MAVNSPNMPASNSGGGSAGIINMIESHPAASIAIIVVIGVMIFNSFRQQTATNNANAGTASGLATDANGNKLVYIPTQTSFSTTNIGAQFSNDPSLTSVTTGNITTNSPTTTTTSSTSTTINPPLHSGPIINPLPPVVPPPIIVRPPVTPPPTHTAPPKPAPRYGLVWGAKHPVTTDDTNHGSGALSYIASKSTQIMQQSQHAPSSVRISAGDIVNHNPGLRTNSLLRLGQIITLPSYARIS